MLLAASPAWLVWRVEHANRGLLADDVKIAVKGHDDFSVSASITAKKYGLVRLTRSISYLYGPDGVRSGALRRRGVQHRATAMPKVD